MILTLCCLFHKENIKFKTYRKNATEEQAYNICIHNIQSLNKAISFCEKNNILSYRISSDLFMYPDIFKKLPYDKLPKEKNVIFSMHPGQHVNMGSPSEIVIENSVKDLKYHLKMSEYLNNKEINIHLGGSYGDKASAKKRFIKNMKENFSKEELSKITIENDELNFNALDVLEVCEELDVRPVFDIHHHRCHQLKEKIDISEEEIFCEEPSPKGRGF